MDSTRVKQYGVVCGLLAALASLQVAVRTSYGQSELTWLPPVDTTHMVPPAEASEEDAKLASSTDDPWFGPVWMRPWSWFAPQVWEGGFEIGINATEGNSQTFSLRTGANLKRTGNRAKTTLDIVYARTEANSAETQHNAQLDSRVVWNLGESPWELFNRFGLEYDEFKPFDVRIRFSGGVGYALVRTEHTTWTGRFGGGASREVDGVDDSWVPEADFGFDFERQLTERQKFTASVDFYPAWEDFSDYRVLTNLAWEILLDEASHLNLKIAVNDRYDSTPHGAKANDVDYAVLLLWKL